MYLKILAVLTLLLSLQACGNGSSGSETSAVSAKYSNWSTVQTVPIGDSTFAAAAVDGTVLYTDHFQGMSLVDASNLEEVKVHTKLVDSALWVSDWGTFDEMHSVAVTGNVAAVAVTPGCLGFCAGRSGEIRLYDIAGRSKATYLSTVESTIMPETLLAEGNYLYVTGTGEYSNNYLSIADIGDTKHPVQLGAVRIDGAGKLAKAENRIFVSLVEVDAAGENYKKIKVIDVSNPATPVLAGPPSMESASGYRYSPIVVSGDVAYVSDWINGLYVVDMTDELSPSLITTIAQPGTVHAMASHGNYLYLACGTGGLRVYDIKDPKAPLLVKEVPTSTSIRFVSVTDGKGIYISDAAAGSNSEQELTIFYVDDAT